MKQLVSLGIFLVLSVIAWWSVTNPFNDEDQLPQPTGKVYAEVFMNEFEMTAMNETGTPDYILKGAHMQRYSDSDDTEIKQPVFQLLQEDREWLVSAEKAIINDKEETIRLSNNVVMKQQNVESAVTIHTQHMLINTKTQVAKTNAHVDIIRGDSRMESKGMIFNNITSELELLSSVNGYYTPYD